MEKFLNSRSTTPTSKSSSATLLTQESSSTPTPLPNSEFKIPALRSPVKLCLVVDLEGDSTEARNTKRKPIRKSPAWEHFTVAEKGDPNDPRGVCNYCGKDFARRMSTYGTSTMLKHLKICNKNPFWIQDPKQKLLSFSTKNDTSGGGNLLAIA